jgi:hypothetical protein
MTANDKDHLLALRLSQRLAVDVSPEDARLLRRAALTLQRWSELECGDSNNYGSWAIERDDNGDGPPYMVHHHWHGAAIGTTTRTRIPDREAGALRRVAALCHARGWHYFHQTDPRGCPLYVSTEPLTDTNYTNGAAICP